MNDTVTKLMALADEYADERRLGFSQEHAQAKRKALEAELTRLFTPLSQSDMVDGFIKHPHETQYVLVFSAGARWAERRHGITGESNET